MGKKRRTCPWYRDGTVWVVHPGWDRRYEMTFNSQSDMIAWAHENKVVLKEVGGWKGGW